MLRRIAAALLVLLLLPAAGLAEYIPYETQVFGSTPPVSWTPSFPKAAASAAAR